MKASKRKFKRWTSTFMAALLLISTFLPSGLIGKAYADQANHVVISQVYGAGGNSGAVYTNDFIELYNPTDNDVILDGWSVQYSSSTGTGWSGTSLSGTIKSHGYYLIQEAAGTTVKDKPFPVAPDATGTIGMGGGSGKVVLVQSQTAVSGQYPTGVVDFVGYGTGTVGYEGSGPTKTPTSALSAVRVPYANTTPAAGLGNAWDTDDNAADFALVAPTPRSTASPTEAPMVPVISLQPRGLNIQYVKNATTVKLVGKADAAEAGSTIKVYESVSKGTAIGSGTAAADGSFEISLPSTTTLSSVFVAATQTGLAESAPIQIDAATASASVQQAKLSYVVTNGVGTLTGNATAAAANAVINLYPNDTATLAERLNTQEVKAGTGGDFSATINNAPDTVYVTQITNTAKGIMLESAAVSVTKADTSVVTKIADVRVSDSKGQPVNLNKTFTIEGVATVDTQILGTQKQNFYLQDDTAGINIFSSTLDTAFKVTKGDKLKMTGRVLYYNGLTEFEPTSIAKVSEGNAIPVPKSLTILDLNTYAVAEPLEGSLVTVTGKVSATASTPPNYNVTFVDENNKATTLRVMGATGIKPDTDLETGKSYTVTGVLGQYTTNASATGGYQVYPRDVKDISPVLAVTHTPITQVYKGASVEFAANADGAENVVVYYRATGTSQYTALQMVKGSQGRYTVSLDAANVPQNGFEYYIEATAIGQIKTAGSSTAPFAVTLVEDTFGPEITGMTPQDTTKVESPTPEISALINDPSGVDETTVHFFLDGQELLAPTATISKTQVKYSPETDLALGVHTVKVSAKDVKGNLTEKQWTFEIVPRFTGGNHYRGTTHNHTNISHDAAGTPEDALKAGKAHHYDWFAFSDHSHDIDPEKLGTDTVDRKTASGAAVPERSGGAQWQLTKDLAKQYTNSDYVVFPAFEMTSTTWGHSNIFGTDNFIDRNINGKQYQDLNQYYAWVMTYDDIVGQFNHPDMSANAFNNFKPYNKDVDKLFTMLEVGNGSGHYGYANAETKFYSALDLGWHVAPTYGEDNHEGTWGQINARTVIVADDLSQASLLHSMRNMRVYMEEDPNFTLDVLANGYYMGSTVDSKKLNFSISGNDPVAEARNSTDYNYLPTSYKSDDRIAKVELITNGGKVVDSITPMTKDFTWSPSYTVTGGQQWFVVKVTQMDGERIYSSPIWSKEESVDVKVNSIDVDGGVVVGGNPAKLVATVANNGTQTISNLKVDFYYDEVKEANFIGTNNISSILSKGSATATATWNSPLVGDHKLIAVVTSLDGLAIGDVKFVSPVKIKEPLGIKVMIDAYHGNENSSGDSGTYKDNLKAFTLMLQKEAYTVVENKVALTDEVLSGVKVLVLTHAKTALTADERAAVTKFINNGGSLLMAGKSNNSTDPTINNALLGDLGSAIRMGNDGVFDLSKTGNFWGDPTVSPYAVRVRPGLVTNYITDRVSFVDYYSGTSLSGVDNGPLTQSGKVTILAKGNETTYQGNIKGGYTYDAVSDTTGGSAIPLVASEEIGAKGRIIVTGMNFFNDKQMDESYEPKGNDELALNSVNWLANRETKVSKIADARKLAEETDVVVEGTVVTGAGNFFDAFYVQDDTGGIMAYLEVPDGALKQGDKVRVYGHIKTFENNKELEFTSFAKDVIKLGTGQPVQPKQVATGEATSAANQGFLVKVKGTVVSKFDENSYVINDGSGDVLVFTDGYIVNQSNVQVPALEKGDTLEAVGLSGAFAQGTRIRVRDTRELVGTKASDTTAPSAPVVNAVTDADESITGTAEAGAKVVAKVDGKEIGTATADQDGKFEITLEMKQTEGTKIVVTATDAAGNTSQAVEVTVIDATAPAKPEVNEVTDKSTSVTGTAEAGAKVVAKVDGKEIGTATADQDGKFEITLEMKQAEGTKIVVTATDAAGNTSQAVEVTVIDATAPAKPEVNEVTDKSTSVTGTAEAGAKVVAKVDGKEIGTATADQDGEFEITLETKQQAGTKIVVTVTDAAGNTSQAVEVTVIDATAPAKPEVNEVTDQSASVTGTAEAGAKVVAKVDGKEIGTATADQDGEFEITLETKQQAGTKIVVTVTDAAGNTSQAVEVTVTDATAPAKPVVNEVTDKSTSVTGTAEAGSKVEVKVSGTVIGTATAGTDGKFSVTIQVQKAGKQLVVTATDKAGNVSAATTVVVKDVTAPAKPVVNEVTDKSTTVTGTAEAGSKVEVKVSGTVIGTATAGTDGKFSVTIQVQKAGKQLVVTATDKAGNVSAATTVVVKDVTAPAKPVVNEVTDKSTSVTGTAEAGSKVEVKVSGTVIGTATAGTDGKFSVTIQVQKAGKQLVVTATDKAGNVSAATTVVVKDVTAPAKPVVNEVTDKSTTVTGTAEAGSKVEVKVSGTVIGTATAGTDGKFSVTIQVQKAGKQLVVTATDKAGNVSAATTVVVKDVTAPAKPVVNEVTDKSTTVTGTAEAGSKVEVKVSGTVIGTATAGTDGKFSVTIQVQKAGKQLVVTATDKAGNVSAATTVVVKDVTAPAKPVVNEVTDKSTLVTGTAEAGSKVEVKVSGTVIGTATAGTDGKFSVTIQVQKAGKQLVVTATDKAGNVSAATTVVVKDVTAPAKPVVNEVTDKSTLVTGTAEAGSKVEVKVSGKVIGTATAGTDGKFIVKIAVQKAGAKLLVTATDKAGNVSAATTVVVKDVTAPAKPVVNEVTDKSTTVTGTAEAGSKVEVKVSGKVIGTATAGTDGKFTVKIAVQKSGTQLVVTATDKAGNVSSAVNVKVTKAVQTKGIGYYSNPIQVIKTWLSKVVAS